ncbi:flagellar hook-basal body complex protein FliE [Undibacterium sp. Ji49W]|uniref:flagellar hook-basal body complex protein FliE n=1 Tax=Undibacterium sp. Ji49W TaxID=3413040 RepID=UPI003BF13658
MEISSIVPITAPIAPDSSGILSTGTVTPTPSFSNMVSQGLQQVNEQLQTSQMDLQALATGDVQNLHQVMIRMEESRLSFQLLLQVRNRLLESYQDIMKMQI